MVRARLYRIPLPAWVLLVLTLLVATTWARPQTQELKGVVVDPKGSPLAAAVCILRGVGLPTEGISVTTDERGRFDFPGLQPRTYQLSCAAAGHMVVTENDIVVTTAPPAPLQIVLPESRKLRQTIEVHETAGPLATETESPASHVTAKQLSSLPLAQEQFRAALPLVPGVVRSPDGKINIKGSVESQSMLLVDGTEMVDPITGSYSIDFPIDAIESWM